MSAVATAGPVADRDLFREVVGHFTTGVTVITTRDRDERFGVTASAVSSLSLEPPMVLVCLNRKLRTCAAVGARGAFAVNVLDEDQGELATQFATRQPDKFRHARITVGELGVPLLADALAHLECRVVEQVDAATHTIFLAEVQAASARSGSPLAYFRGTFGRFEQPLDDAVYQELRERVLDREIGPGLTTERLAGELDVGRAPVYHALHKLSTEGLVSVVPQQGYVVTPLTIDVAWQAYDARAAIECGVLDQVGDRLDVPQLAAVRAAAEATLPWIRANRFVDLERYLTTNKAFHDTIVDLAGNETLLAGYRRVAMAGVMSRALRGVQETDDRFTAQHLELAEALEARDVQAARRIVLAHAELGKERVQIAIEAAGGQY